MQSMKTPVRLQQADTGFENSPFPEGTSSLRQPRATVLSLSPEDPENPINLFKRRKSFIVMVGMFTILNGVLGSTLPSGGIAYIGDHFKITDNTDLVLPVSVYQVGFVLGALLFGPLSEIYGRQIIMILPFGLFTVFTLASSFAPGWTAYLLFRWICGACASSAMAVTGGIYADIYHSPVARGRANALFLAATTVGPQFAPVMSGFMAPINWQWPIWIATMLAAICFMALLFLPETYAPVILRRRAKTMRKIDGNTNVYAPIELKKQGARQFISVYMARPIRMMVFESVVQLSCLYLAFETDLFFQAFPLIFQGIYGMEAGISGLAFFPVAIGAVFGLCGFLYYDNILHRATERGATWASNEEYRRLPLACLGGPLCVIALFWLGWTSSPRIHWIIPMLAGFPFGCGFFLILAALLNYIGDAYRTSSASAMAAISCSRSFGGAILPLVAQSMYKRLGVSWATSLLGFLSFVLSIVPFMFVVYGDKIRAGSKIYQNLAYEQQRELDTVVPSLGSRRMVELSDV